MLPSLCLRALRPAAAYGLAVAVSLVAGPSPAHALPIAQRSVVADTTGADGRWSLLYAPKGRGYPGVVRDSRRDRLVMFGGLGGLNTGIAYHDVWTMPLAGRSP